MKAWIVLHTEKSKALPSQRGGHEGCRLARLGGLKGRVYRMMGHEGTVCDYLPG